MPLSYYITQARVCARAHCETPFTPSPSPHPSTPLVEILQRWTVCLLALFLFLLSFPLEFCYVRLTESRRLEARIEGSAWSNPRHIRAQQS